jgi:hypothetical protein
MRRVENQLGSTGARTDYGKRRISFSGPTIFNSLGCNIGLDMDWTLQCPAISMLPGKLATLNHLVELFGVVWADSLSLYCSLLHRKNS